MQPTLSQLDSALFVKFPLFYGSFSKHCYNYSNGQLVIMINSARTDGWQLVIMINSARTDGWHYNCWHDVAVSQQIVNDSTS